MLPASNGGAPQRQTSVFDENPTDQGVKFLKLAQITLGWISLPVEMFARREFGERYLSMLQLWVAWGVLLPWTLFVAPLLFGGVGPLMILYMLAYVGLGIYHRVMIWRRTNIEGRLWHSRSFGISRFAPLAATVQAKIAEAYPGLGRFLTLDRWFLYRWFEPGLALALGLLLRKLDPALGTFLILAALGLCIKSTIAYYEHYNRILDLLDSRIESQFLAQAVEGRPEEEAAGVAATPVPPVYRDLLTSDPVSMAARVREVMGEEPTAEAARDVA